MLIKKERNLSVDYDKVIIYNIHTPMVFIVNKYILFREI